MKLESLRELFLDELQDVYDAETQLVEALPKMAKAASSTQLQQAFNQHYQQTREHVNRLEQIFQQIDQPVKAKKCKAMSGLIKEGEEYMMARADSDTRDAALISSAQRVEHYEMAAYGTLRAYAQTLGYREAVRLLQTTLDEEGAADKKLTELAEAGINVQAAQR